MQVLFKTNSLLAWYCGVRIYWCVKEKNLFICFEFTWVTQENRRTWLCLLCMSDKLTSLSQARPFKLHCFQILMEVVYHIPSSLKQLSSKLTFGSHFLDVKCDMQQAHTRKHHPADTSWLHFLYFSSSYSTCTPTSCFYLQLDSMFSQYMFVVLSTMDPRQLP